MTFMLNSGWAKIEKYYNMTDESLAYVAAIILDPNIKWKYIENNWRKAWHRNIKTIMDKLWREYKPIVITFPASFLGIATPEISSTKNVFITWKKRHQAIPSVKDEYKRYYVADYTYDVNPRTWWMEITQQVNYSNLSKLALDILLILAILINPERLFLSVKMTITDLRNRLGINIIKTFKYLKSWYKLKGWEEKFKYLEEVFGEEIKEMGINHVQSE